MLVDPLGRRIDYLRISLTDRCNLRCLYCYPPLGLPLADPSRLLRLEEIVRVARVGIDLGIRRIKLTGGEPLLSPHVVPLVERLASISEVLNLSVTTNGSRLRALAKPLHLAGLRRLNLSIDSLDPKRYARICAGGDLDEVLAGFQAARRLGLEVKVNTVALRGWNTDEALDFVRFAEREDVEIRFIEFMPLCGQGWDRSLFVSAKEIREQVEEEYGPLLPLPRTGVAQRFLTGTGARIGFIPTMSQPFCDRCRRMRLTAWGTLRPCLFSGREFDLRPLLSRGTGDAELRAAFQSAVRGKPARNPVLAGEVSSSRVLIRSIGG